MTALPANERRIGDWPEVFVAFLKLGVTAFGGPVAHFAYYRREFVERRGWLDEAAYGDIVALCQFLPGPASSQTGIMIGLTRAGYAGAFAAWTAFTLPSAVLMTAFAFLAPTLAHTLGGGWLHGLKLAAVAVVAQAVIAMMRTLAPDRLRATLAVLAMVAALAIASPLIQLGAIGFGAIAGVALLRHSAVEPRAALPVRPQTSVAVIAILLFAGIIIGLPLLAQATGSHGLDLFARIFRVGSLVFGGGHVALPLLAAQTVPPGWIGQDAFMAGYGAVQAMPGPLFTFAAYLGAIMGPEPNGVAGALICLGAIFAPSFLLLAAVLPFWEALRRGRAMQGALKGANAAVVGLLMAALYDPVWTSAVMRPLDVGFAATAFLLLTAWRAPPWLVVLLSAVCGQVLAAAL